MDFDNTNNDSNNNRKKLIAIFIPILSGIIGAAAMALLLFATGAIQNSNYTALNTIIPSVTESPASDSDTKGSQDVTINVSDVDSPAVAVAAKVRPSVVGIEVVTYTSSSKYGTKSVYSVGSGSGVIYTADGYIFTNYHVISDVLTTAGEINNSVDLSVYLFEDPTTPIPATLIGYDIGSDLAVIKIEKTGLPTIELGDSSTLQVGDISFVVGCPSGIEFIGSITQGIISGLNRKITIESSYENVSLIQTDSAINPGNSGGALVNLEGKLIGITSAKIVATNYESIGFAIPVDHVLAVCQDIINNGQTQNAYLGVEFDTDYTADYLERLGYPGGLLISNVVEGSPAANAGLEEDDIVVAWNGSEVRTVDAFKELKASAKPGDEVTIRVYRLTTRTWSGWKGEYLDIKVTLS